MKEALEKSIRHWAKNVKALEKIQGVEGKFKNAGYSFHFNCSEIVKYGVDDCALCDKYLYSGIKCIACLLKRKGFWCDLVNSPWRQVALSKNRRSALKASRHMLEVLKSCRGK